MTFLRQVVLSTASDTKQNEIIENFYTFLSLIYKWCIKHLQ